MKAQYRPSIISAELQIRVEISEFFVRRKSVSLYWSGGKDLWNF